MSKQTYTYTTQAAVRRAFWADCEGHNGVTRKRIRDYSGRGLMHNTDTRCAFADWLDAACCNGDVSQALADRVTL